MTRYKVQRGDTLGKIATKFYGNSKRFPLIVAANAIPNPDKLAIGQELTIPDANVAMSALPSPPSLPIANAMPASKAGDTFTRLSDQRLAGVHPRLATRARAMIDLCAHDGITLLISQGLRTWAEQDALYAKGRSLDPIGKKFVVTNAKGGESWHNFGLAFDIVVLDSVGKADWDITHPAWSRSAEIGKSLALEWGGDWKTFKDRPHFQYTGGLTLGQCRQLFASGLQSIWEKVT